MADLDITSCNFVSISFIPRFDMSVSRAILSFLEAHDHNTGQYKVILCCFVCPQLLMVSAANIHYTMSYNLSFGL